MKYRVTSLTKHYYAENIEVDPKTIDEKGVAYFYFKDKSLTIEKDTIEMVFDFSLRKMYEKMIYNGKMMKRVVEMDVDKMICCFTNAISFPIKKLEVYTDEYKWQEIMIECRACKEIGKNNSFMRDNVKYK